MNRAACGLAGLAMTAALAGCGDLTAGPPHPTPSGIPTPAIPSASASQIAAQDHPSRRQQRPELGSMREHPLLDHLPLSVGGVAISIAGLARDNQTVLLRVDRGSESRAAALEIYRDALAAYGDSGRGYRASVVR